MRELNGIVALFVGVSASMTLLRSARVSARDNRGWIVVSGLVLVLAIALTLLWPDFGGLVSAGVWLVLSLIPAMGLRRLDQLVARGDYDAARRLAHWLRRLHPADGWTALPLAVEALALADAGDYGAAKQLLEAPDVARSPLGQAAAAQFFLLRDDWAGLLDWIRDNRTLEQISRDPSMIVTYLRALGETGELNGLLATFAALDKSIRRHRGQAMGLAYLFVFAFNGRRDLVERLFAGPLSRYPEPIQRLWTATADMATGDVDAARAQLRAIRSQADGETQTVIDRRLAHPLARPEEALTADSRRILARLERDVEPRD